MYTVERGFCAGLTINVYDIRIESSAVYTQMSMNLNARYFYGKI